MWVFYEEVDHGRGQANSKTGLRSRSEMKLIPAGIKPTQKPGENMGKQITTFTTPLDGLEERMDEVFDLGWIDERPPRDLAAGFRDLESKIGWSGLSKQVSPSVSKEWNG